MNCSSITKVRIFILNVQLNIPILPYSTGVKNCPVYYFPRYGNIPNCAICSHFCLIFAQLAVGF